MTPDRVLLLGLGGEARAAVAYLNDCCVQLRAMDDHAPALRDFCSRHVRAKPLENLEQASLWLQKAEQPLILRAPGVPPSHEGLRALAPLAPVTTYTGLWLSHHRDRVLATITGTKGKSSVTDLCARLMQALGRDVRAGGNIGIIPSRPEGDERYVLELSSYQCHDLLACAPIHAVTSLFVEHTDWHGGHRAYRAAKFHPFTLHPTPKAVLPASLRAELPAGVEAHLIDDTIEQIKARGVSDPVRAHNGAMALTIARLALPKGAAEDALSALLGLLNQSEGLPSRRARIATEDGITWIDDALATIPEATRAALEALPGRTAVHLILGGKDRGQDFSQFGQWLSEQAHVSVYAYSETLPKIEAAYSGRLQSFDDFASLLDAVRGAAAPGDIVLFSPAAATPEPRQNFQDRASSFARTARQKP
jgi:UDP-N-acetylmuramoylalanine--D-glutamate ligase